jgi:hypothetical protein
MGELYEEANDKEAKDELKLEDGRISKIQQNNRLI